MLVFTMYVSASYALWLILGTSTFPVVSDVRDWCMSRSAKLTEFIYCPLCSGFWCALLMTYVIPINYLRHYNGEHFTERIGQALCCAVFIFLIDKHVSRIDAR